MMIKGKIRGTILNGYINYIKRNWGQKGITDFEEYLGESVDQINESEWYNSDLLKKAHLFIADKGPDHVRLAGQYEIQNLGLLSYLVKYFNVKTLLKKAPKNYKEGFSYGESEIEIGDKEAVVKLKNVMIDQHVCDAWQGVLEGALKATNTEGVVKPIFPEDRGEFDCFYKVEWK